MPVVRGETERGGGYHHYPSEEQVAAWLADEGLAIVAQDHSPGDGYGYWHLLPRTPGQAPT